MTVEPPTGLSEALARERLLQDGPNELPVVVRHGFVVRLLEVLREPMFALLLGAAGLYFLLGEWPDALILMGFATASFSITLIQQGRSEHVLQSMRKLASPRALVLREGLRRAIPARDLVRGDLLLLAEGDRIPADVRLVSGGSMQVDESLLTGESVPVAKEPRGDVAVETATMSDEDSAGLYSGCLIVHGNGLGLVIATGATTRIGRLGRALNDIVPETPRLQRQTRRLVTGFAIVGMSISVLAIVSFGLARGEWLQGLLAGIALAMSMIPEEVPLVLTVFMVMGAWRLSSAKVLARRASAIEVLGSATVLCTDKTGTLTRNQMAVVQLWLPQAQWQAGDSVAAMAAQPDLDQLLDTALLASETQAVDPMDKAIVALALEAGISMPNDDTCLRSYGLRRELLAVLRAWKSQSTDTCRVAAKGAPEAILRLCQMDETQVRGMLEAVERMAMRGVRVLAVAAGEHAAAGLPDDSAQFRLRFLGLVGLQDPLRSSVREAVRECRNAGVRVIMITGDHPRTARAIADAAGFAPGGVVTGKELGEFSDDELMRRMPVTAVFARTAPEQKLRIVQALKRSGEVVAMTGDGVNDAAALKAADIGIAMGLRGTDVAREAASLVLVNDDFGAIVQAIRTGRRIYDNLRKALRYIVAVHVPIAGIALLCALAGLPLLMTPVLIAFLELIIDPSCSIVFEAEPEEQDVMRRPPRNSTEPLINTRLALWALGQGALAFLVVALPLLMQWRVGAAAETLRSQAILMLAGTNLALVFVNRSLGASWRALLYGNAALWWGVSAVAATMALMLYWTPVRGFFALGRLEAADVAICLGVAVALVGMLQGAKYATRRIPAAVNPERGA